MLLTDPMTEIINGWRCWFHPYTGYWYATNSGRKQSARTKTELLWKIDPDQAVSCSGD